MSLSLADMHQRMRITAYEDISSVAFSPNGAHLLTGRRDNTARLWDAATGDELRAFKGHTGTVLSVALSTDGTRVLTGASDRQPAYGMLRQGRNCWSLGDMGAACHLSRSVPMARRY